MRDRASATLEREAKILDEVLRGAADDAVLVVPQLKPKIEARLGKPLALSSLCRVLARHGWCKEPAHQHRSTPACQHAAVVHAAYSPELNPVEHLRGELRQKHFQNRVFDSLYAVEDHLMASLHDFELDQSRIHSITAWQWITDAVSNANLKWANSSSARV